MNKRILLLLALSFCPVTARSQETSGPSGRIRVSIGNLRSPRGLVGVALFNAKKGFPDKPERAVEGRSIEANGRCEVVFDNIPYGTYAVSVLHDENANRRMDKTIIGIPREGFGTSNNPKIRRGPPSFEESCIMLDRRELALKIEMNYF